MTAPSDLHDRPEDDDDAVERVAARGPVGAFTLAGIATAIVVLIYIGFYVFFYLPRGAVQ